MFNRIENHYYNLNTGFPITQSVINGSQKGSVFQFGQNYFILHKAGFSSLIHSTNCFEELLDLFRSEYIPEYFHLYNSPEVLVAKLEELKSEFNFKIRTRIQLEYIYKDFLSVNKIDGFLVKNVNSSNFDQLQELGLMLDSKFWNSNDDFISGARGLVATDKIGNPVSICYAASLANQKAEIDVLTVDKFRGKGLAKTLVSYFVNNCISDNIIPNWDCFEDNFGSINTALSLNFLECKKYNFLSIFKQKKV
jgi:hypothetical protein